MKPQKKLQMDKTHNERAVEKIKAEISKDINKTILLAKVSGYGELFYYLHYLHSIRLLKTFNNIPESEQKITEVYVNQLTDAYKYIIQLLLKYSQKKFVSKDNNSNYIDSELVILINQIVLQINSKYETLSFISLFNDLEVSGERDRYMRIDMKNILSDERLNKFFHYSFRADKENDFHKADLKTKDNFLNHFKYEYELYSDLFELEFGMKLEDFIKLIDFILETITKQIKDNEHKFVHLENGNIDIQAYGTIMNFCFSLKVSKKIIIEMFGDNANNILERLIFKPNEFNENQLRFNLIARQPLIDLDNNLFVSPELLLDSLFINSHYSFLEAGNHKEEYKKRYASFFVDKIKEIALKYDYLEVTRELELYENRNQIGDIDLVLKNSKNHFLLIEAKNHAIPLDVYFHDFEATEKRLVYLQNEWEKKVQRRNDHLKINHANYNISSSFTYLIISKSTEILSHFSEFLVLTLEEFDFWLKQDDLNLSFEKIFEDIYKINETEFTDEQLEKINKDLNVGWTFRKE